MKELMGRAEAFAKRVRTMDDNDPVFVALTGDGWVDDDGFVFWFVSDVFGARVAAWGGNDRDVNMDRVAEVLI